MPLDGTNADEQARRDLFVAEPLGDQSDDLALPADQTLHAKAG
jgi:hypothetical protein